MSYTDKLQHFREAFEVQHNARLARLFSNPQPDTVRIETGYKFDKVFLVTLAGTRLDLHTLTTLGPLRQR